MYLDTAVLHLFSPSEYIIYTCTGDSDNDNSNGKSKHAQNVQYK